LSIKITRVPTSSSDNPDLNKVKVYQNVPDDCRIKVYQDNASDHKVEVRQSTASNCKVEPVQTDHTQNKATVYNQGPEVRRDYTVAPSTVSLSDTTARTASALSSGQYTVISNIDVYILQGDSSVDATTSSHWLPAGLEVPVYVTGTSDTYIAGITDGGSGTLFISKVD